MADREATFWIGDVLDQAGREGDLVDEVKILAGLNVDFSHEERNLFSVAFKNQIGTRRAAWRVLSSIRSENEGHLALIKSYKKKLEDEMVAICDDVFSLLDTNLLPNATSDENKVYWHKMKGDYYRYQAEFLDGEKRDAAKAKASEAYEAALAVGRSLQNHSTNPIYLGLALNFSVFQYEILHTPEDAIKTAQAAYDGAIAGDSDEQTDQNKDAPMIVQLLRENIDLWTSALEEEGDD